MIRVPIKFVGLAICVAWAALPLGAQQPPKVEMLTAHRMGKTPPMREYLATHHIVPNAPYRVFPLRKAGSHPGQGGSGTAGSGSTGWTDPVLQSSEGSTQIGAPIAKFEGVGSVGYVPPDTNISVGPNQVVETVNVDWQVYDKTGKGLLPNGPAPIHSIFQAAAAAGNGNLAGGDACATIDGGDPIVLYDKVDRKWFISQMAYNSSFTQNEYCLAISETGDATGSYYAYDLPFGSNLPDYPKLGIWADAGSATSTSWTNLGSYAGVYFSANIFLRASSFTGAVMCGFPLSQVASPPSSLNWVCAYNGTSVYSILPADVEGSPGVSGTTLPAPANTAEYYMQFSGSNTLNLYSFAPDFTNGTATVNNVGNVSVDTFSAACSGGACVPQLNTTNPLDSLGDRLMYRLSYRNDGTNQYMAVTQSVQDSSASSQTGVRWYQLTEPAAPNSSGGWNVKQQSTFGPADGVYRWMGSIAQDKFGDLGIGYSTSSPSSFPGMGYTGQAVGEATGTLEGEQQLSIGGGDQTSVDRWGDYSSMSVDPTDDCTFWYANEYLKYGGSYTNWGTYFVSFAFPACTGTATPDFSLSASPTSQTVTAGGNSTSYGVTVTPIGTFNSDVTLGLSGQPSGVSYNYSPSNIVSGGNGTPTLNVSADVNTTPGTYTLNITGSDGNNTSHSIPVTLVVNGASSGNFSLNASAFSSSLSAKSSASTTITVNGTGGFSGAVTLSVSGLPHGTNAKFNPSSVNGSGSSTLTVSAGGHPQTGLVTLTITGTSGSLSSSTTLTLDVQ